MPEAQRLAREYELVYILRPTVGPSEARKVSDRIRDIVDRSGAKLTKVDNWGKRKLAYPIRKHTRGIFVLVKFVGFGGLVAELERNLKILDDVVRWQTIRLEEVEDFEGLNVEPEEVEFRDIEAGEDDEEEPSFEERLGMKAREPEKKEEKEEPAEGEAKSGDGAEAKSGDGAEAKSGDGAEAKSGDAGAEGDAEKKAEAEKKSAAEGEDE
jgi:small subunit ribosomal protein S6